MRSIEPRPGRPRRIHYYRCPGSDAYRYPEGARCDNRPIQQDHLDDMVWQESLGLQIEAFTSEIEGIILGNQ